jgi:uncharacterized membrane protein YbhN (UPF0104 family)
LKAPPRSVLVAAQLVAAALLVYFVGRTLAAQWAAFRDQPLDARFRWGQILASGALVLFTHALLVQTWRMLLRSWNASLPFWTAARIWSISNLAKYVPGKIWQVTAMGTMAHHAGVSPVVSTGSALLSTIINIACGIAIVLGLGWEWLNLLRADARVMATALITVAILGLSSLPFIVPRLGAIVSRLTNRLVEIVSPPPRVILAAIAANVLAWVLYGVAFLWLVRGVLGGAPGAAWGYVAVYTASYVVGYLFFIVPGGIGPREAVMVSLLTSLALATPKQALLVAAASRVWLTILEIVPGLVFMALRGPRRPSHSPADATTK